MRRGITARLSERATASSLVLDHRRFYTTPAEEEQFRKEGLLDENGLTVFDTLHEMIHGSCRVYSRNDVFGTYNPQSAKFEYMSYQEFGTKVDQCRSMLKNIGTCLHNNEYSISINPKIVEDPALAFAVVSLQNKV